MQIWNSWTKKHAKTTKRTGEKRIISRNNKSFFVHFVIVVVKIFSV